jgi:TonB family protein
MTPCFRTRLLFALLLVATAHDGAAARQTDRRPLPPGSAINVHDGDTVLIDDDARVMVIRRRRARVRVVWDPNQRWLILLARYRPENGITADVVDAFTFRDIDGDWTLGNKWEGDTTVDVYSLAESAGSAGVGVRTAQGLVQLLTREQAQFRDPAATLVLGYRGSSRSTSARGSFDEVERLRIAEASGTRAPTVSASPTISVTEAPVRRPAVGFPPTGSPRKTHDVRPVWPEEARRAGVQGIVIVDFTVSVDGDVTDARILRGIPMLDQAALDCVRQWHYEPVVLNGQPIPVRMTATVTFP